MEYQKIINLLDNTPNQPSKFRTENWFEIIDGSYETCNTGSQIKFKTSMIRSSLCDYSDTYILVKGTLTIENAAAKGVAPNHRNKKVKYKNYAPFTDCLSQINNDEIDHAKNIDLVIPMYKLIEYTDNYWKTSGILW